MSMLSERLQVLIDVEQRERLEKEASSRGASVATLVREAIDLAFPAGSERRRSAADAVLSLDGIIVGDPDELRAELDDIRDWHS